MYRVAPFTRTSGGVAVQDEVYKWRIKLEFRRSWRCRWRSEVRWKILYPDVLLCLSSTTLIYEIKSNSFVRPRVCPVVAERQILSNRPYQESINSMILPLNGNRHGICVYSASSLNNEVTVMRKLVPVIMFATLFAVSQLVAARGGGPGPSGGGDTSHFGGPSSNSQAAANSNGRFASDRDTGLDRAEDRMSAKGKAHEKATHLVNKTPRSARGHRGAK